MKQHRPLEKGKQYPQEITCTWELTEPPTALTYTYTSYLFCLLGPKLFVEESKERLENCSVKTGKVAWVRPGGWKRQSCAQGCPLLSQALQTGLGSQEENSELQQRY